MKIRFLHLGWEVVIDIPTLNEALEEVYNGKNSPYLTEVTSVGSEPVVVVSAEKITPHRAQKIYDYYEFGPGARKQPAECPFEKAVLCPKYLTRKSKRTSHA